MDRGNDPRPEEENGVSLSRDDGDGIFLITEEEYYDLLMEQQEQM